MRRFTLSIVDLLVVFLTNSAISFAWKQSSSDSGKKILEAAGVLDEIVSIPEQTIPPSLLRDARAIVVLPSLLKAGFFIGGRYVRECIAG